MSQQLHLQAHHLPPAHALCVLKFGSSVVRDERDFPRVVQEIYAHVREGEKVVAVVSALAGDTDALLGQAERVGGEAAPANLVARLARVGELRSAALLALALAKVGVRAATLDPHEMKLVAEGPALDSDLVDLDAAHVLAALQQQDVVVVPGFIADHEEHGVVTLGRGGTDLSAVFFADRLQAHRVRLIKDVDGVYEADPSEVPGARRFERLSYAEAEVASDGLVQPKALRVAADKKVLVEVAALGSCEATVICDLGAKPSAPLRSDAVRLSLLGCGAVGGGVKQLLEAQPDVFELGPVLVQRPRSSRPGEYTRDLDEALADEPELLVELIGGTDLAADAMHRALSRGAEVVTGNKAALAKHWDSLHACAARHGGGLRFSAAVGGGAPIVETLRRLKGEVAAVEGVMNGTCNFLLSRLAEGWDFDRALATAQELGFAEADPSGDVDGHDAADKLSILVREAFGVALPPSLIPKQSLRDLAPGAAAEAQRRGEVLKQVGRCWLEPDGSAVASVQVVALPADHVLASVHNEENRFLVTDAGGKMHQVHGKGAGRWPTATAVMADVLDARRAILGKERTVSGPLKLSA
ncbi:homoserine dehydrogenase [Sphingomonas glaciei]|uniref:Homoserine dehydrogenase n=1 Tax=Sphingomonas glaciei TaxID=2938948 RepID=A0ABY5MX55_9SPHN|nr:homoserine dehydrogenase [Sphingomonas glaciei]UUR08355.1 homoserine dehydrogenase [Sphingomonas glaciei]